MTDLFSNHALLFLAMSALVGVGIMLEMGILIRNKGKVPSIAFVHWLSFFNIIWVFVCGAVLYFMELTALQKSIPMLFIFYHIFAIFYGSANIDGIPERLEDIEFKKPYLDFGFSFGLVFMVWSVIVAWHTHQPIELLSAL